MQPPFDELGATQLAGKAVDKYVILESIGNVALSLSSANVFKVHKEGKPDALRAMKIYIKELSTSPEFKNDFNRNMECWLRFQDMEKSRKANLEHIVRIEDQGIVSGTGTGYDGCLFFVMEYMDDETLDDHPQLQMKEKLRIVSDAARGVEEAHRAKVLHLDIHGKNILLHDEGNIVKIADFGVSALIDEKFPYQRASKRAIRFPAEEQKRGKAHPATDVYQLAATLYYHFVGSDPGPGSNELLAEHQEIPSTLRDLINKCLNPHYEKRAELGDFIQTLDDQRDTIIRREIRYADLIRDATSALRKISELASTHDYEALSAAEVDKLYMELQSQYKKINKEGFSIPIESLEKLMAGVLNRDFTKMMDFARQYEPSEVEVVSNTVSKQADAYADATLRWKSNTGRKFTRLLPDYKFKIK